MTKKCICIIGDIERNIGIRDYLKDVGIIFKKDGFDVVSSDINIDGVATSVLRYCDIYSNQALEPEKIVMYIFIPGSFHNLAFQMSNFRKHDESDAKAVPIILLDNSYWQPVLKQFQNAIEAGISPKGITNKIHLLDIGDEEALFECISYNDCIST